MVRDGLEKKAEILSLASMFFALNILISIQDIAVYGWALTLLQPRNVGYLATCNAVGRTAGYVVGFIIFLVLESKDFCNKFIFIDERDECLITTAGFLKF